MLNHMTLFGNGNSMVIKELTSNSQPDAGANTPARATNSPNATHPQSSMYKTCIYGTIAASGPPGLIIPLINSGASGCKAM